MSYNTDISGVIPPSEATRIAGNGSSYDRRYKIYVDDQLFVEGGPGRQLRITFSLSSGFRGRNGTGDLAIFNLSPGSVSRIQSGAIIKIEAGYVGAMDLIYTGKVATVLRERVGTDIALRMLMNGWVDQDKKWSYTFPANSSVPDIIEATAKQAGYPLAWKRASFESLPRQPRGYLISNTNPVKALMIMADEFDFGLSIERGRIVLNKADGDQGTTPYEINEMTGMEMLPEVTWAGVDVVVRLNPRLVPGIPFEVTSKYATYVMANAYHDHEAYRGYELGRGLHYIQQVEHQGDSWGDMWSTSIVGHRPR